MLNKKEMHWPYYLSIESDLDRISRYVEFCEDNYKTYSIELVKLLLTIGSEVDVVLKKLCILISGNEKLNNIGDYRRVILSELLELPGRKVEIRKHGLKFSPWDRFVNNKSPHWWMHYNKVKHNRGEYFKMGNLENVLSSMAGLYLVNIYLHFIEMKHSTDWPHDFIEIVSKMQNGFNLFMLDDMFLKFYSNC